MNRPGSWLFEMPFTQASNYHTEYETALEQEWELNPFNSLTENEWEVPPIKRTVGRSTQVPRRQIPRRNSKPVMPRRRGGIKPLGRSVQSAQPSAAGSKIRIATIDLFEFGSYLFKKHQSEQVGQLLLLLNANKPLLSQIQLDFRGHTDNVGGNSIANSILSMRRAFEVESFVKRFFRNDSPNLATFISGAAAKEPIAPNTTENRRARNRRVEVFSNVPLKPQP